MPNVIQENVGLISNFLAQNCSPQPTVVDVYHKVRKIPYGSRGGRTVEAVIENNEGSCSGKHILLHQLLRRMNHDAHIETVRGDFASRVPALDTMPDELKQMCLEGGVPDFHQYVVWNSAAGECKLDATWSDGPIKYGFEGNNNWSGVGDTILALDPEEVLDRVDDIPGYKARLLTQLSNGDRQRRLDFLALLSNWVAKSETEGF